MVNEKHRILKLLIEDQESRYSIRKIALKRKINYKSAYNAAYALKEEGSITMEEYGNTTICRFARRLTPTVFEVESERRDLMLKNKDLALFTEDLNKEITPKIVLLFGSYAKGTATKHSDIDLLIITEHEKDISKLLSLYPFKIHPTIITYKDFVDMLKSREFTVVSEAIKKNILLIGIEHYYGLVQDAKP